VVATSIGVNVIASDQYIAIVLPARMFRVEFDRRGLLPVSFVTRGRRFRQRDFAAHPLEQLRSLYGMAAALGVPALSYGGFAFFNLLNPLATIAVALLGFGMAPVRPIERVEGSEAPG
jgi:NhaC family Na+:H+ antiporter